MEWNGPAGFYILWGLGGLAHLVCLAGLVIGMRSRRRATSLRFALAGLASVLALGLAAWFFYRQGLALADQGYGMATAVNRGVVKLTGISLAQEHLTLCLYLSILPLLSSVGLLVRGLTLDPEPDAARGAWRPLLATACLVGGAGLLVAALLSYLSPGPFIFSLLHWVT